MIEQGGLLTLQIHNLFSVDETWRTYYSYSIHLEKREYYTHQSWYMNVGFDFWTL
jgi:hypothetical protein